MAAVETKSADRGKAMDVLAGIIGKKHAEALVDGSSTTLTWVCEDELDEDGLVKNTKDTLGEAGIEALAELLPVSP